MAPEQWSGAADPRSDLFACGAVFFEMVTGRPAFRGTTPLEILQAALRGEPPALGGVGFGGARAVLRRALAPRGEDRYASADEMAQALAAVEGDRPRTMVEARVKRLLVLPFRLLRPDPEIDFLTIALADAITASLARLTHLVVRSSKVLRAADDDPARVAAEAGVDAVLYGTLLRSGDRVRVSTQLVDGASGTVASSSTAEASMRDLFELQDELARQVVSALRVPLAPDERPTHAPPRPPEPRAYELYLRAAGTPLSTARSSSLLQARDLLRESVDIDPGLASAWALLGRIHRLIAKFAHGPREENVRAARQAFETALALDPDSPQAHNLYTYFEIEEMGSPVQAMLRLLGRLANHRSDAGFCAGLVTACRYTGLFEASRAAHRLARELDPQIRTGVPYTYWMMGDYRRAAELDDEPVPFVRNYALPMLGREAEAIASYQEWRAKLQGGLEVTMADGMIAAMRGDRAACEAAVDVIDQGGFSDAEGLYFVARILAKVGSVDRALDTLDRVVSSGFTCPTTFARDTWLESLRGVPRFATIQERASRGTPPRGGFVRARRRPGAPGTRRHAHHDALGKSRGAGYSRVHHPEVVDHPLAAGLHGADQVARLAGGAQRLEDLAQAVRRHDEHHADAHVEDAEHLLALDVALLAAGSWKSVGHRPAAALDHGVGVLGQDARQVVGEPAAGDVRHARAAPRWPSSGRSGFEVGAVRRQQRSRRRVLSPLPGSRSLEPSAPWSRRGSCAPASSRWCAGPADGRPSRTSPGAHARAVEHARRARPRRR